ncbi:MAG: type II secretion system protein GspN [Nitrospinae bacterium]|nr:type II secretion system protein GspN [Nitrospinota bacterium]
MQGWRRPMMVGGYVAYGLALFGLFVYITFPGQQVRALVLTSLSHHGLHQIRIGAVHPLFPPGLAFRQVSVAHEANGQPVELLRMPEVRTYLRPPVPFGNLLRLHFEGEVYGGNLLGDVAWASAGEGPAVEISAQFQDVHLDALPLAGRLGKANLEGKLEGSMTWRLTGSRWEDGEGSFIFKAKETGGLAGLEVMGVRFPPLAYEQLGGKLVLQARTVVIQEDILALGRNRTWQLNVQGRIGLRDILPQSTLDLTLRVRASEALEQQLGLVGTFLKQRRDRRGFSSFRVGGTLGNPTFIQ